MGLKINYNLKPSSLRPKIERMFELSAEKILSIEKTWNRADGAPVFTKEGRYTTRGWTDWTQGFQYGSALLQFDATGDTQFLEIGRLGTIKYMDAHLTHSGVHDHGFNIISTYGTLLRLISEGKIPLNKNEANTYILALKVSGAVQAMRWTDLPNNLGYIYSFNGPHSLFIDTMRTLRSLGVAYKLGHFLMGEKDRKISLLHRSLQHSYTTANYSIYYGKGRDIYDVRGRVAHECIFNINDGSFRCPNSQQGYSPFSTWTRGLAWAILGFTEVIELFESLNQEDILSLPEESASINQYKNSFYEAAIATADYYIKISCADGVPVWDTGAPNLHKLGDYLNKPSDPFNPYEPVDSSAAAIAAQGFLRLGNILKSKNLLKKARIYRQAAFTIADTLLAEPYLSVKSTHQGLLLHSVYHRPNGWDYIRPGQKVPNGESSMWGDYHLRELGLIILRELKGENYFTYFSPATEKRFIENLNAK